MFLFITPLLCPSYQVGHMSFIISMATVSSPDSFAISNPSDLQRASASFVPVRSPSYRDKIITDNLNSAPVLRRERRRRLLFYSFLFHTLSVRPTTSLFLSFFALPTLKAKRLNVWYVKTGPALWLQTVTAKYKDLPELSDNKSGRFKAWHQQHLKENYNKARTRTWKMEKHAKPICTKSLGSKKELKGKSCTSGGTMSISI